MDLRGQIQGISVDYRTKTPLITLSVVEGEINALNDLADKDLTISLKQYRQKRSLDANAYLWVLCTKIADKIKTSKEEVYEDMLRKYAPFYKDSDGYVVVTLKASIDTSKLPGHWKLYKSTGAFNSYLMIKGSSDYNTAEMSHFIDMVVLEAKELGIETLPPDELERMKTLYGKEVEKRVHG